jgi:nuclear receptor interaction protein
LKADAEVVNVMTGHPTYPVIAASGIDHTVKIFSPEGLGKGLRSRQSLQDEYKVRSRNDVHRRQGLQGIFISRERLLDALGLRFELARQRAENPESPEGCETM